MTTYSRRIKTFGGRKATFPLKDIKDVEMILYWFLKERENSKSSIKRFQYDRNWMLCFLGFNTTFRAEDLLQLRVQDLINGYISIKENKTGKPQNFKMDNKLFQDVLSYFGRNNLRYEDYIFKSQMNSNMAITRQQANNVLKKVSKATKLKSRFSMHTLRKTFGYHYYNNKGNLMTLMRMYNHDSPNTTLLYVCWGTDDAEKDRANTYIGGVHRKKGKN
ncbi:MAG: tyrosine-type recombinase/integrase [Clostridia bacterium]|nr:tyrosine-type recombinase/integrase [Clostridia bacterium]